MPVDRRVDFLAVDEVQLAADRERGHVFTDRILHARGQLETMLIGAETIRPLLRRLLPEAAFLSRPRLSTLRYSPPKKLARLPRRSAVIVFSVRELYAIAERLRRERGGSALVFGALSPRTRNAQVALYQAGEVDHLVATDAIGMGLNLDIDHVVFTGLAKFDGVAPRELTAAEVAQIAGRAGRHVQDGSVQRRPPSWALSTAALVEAVESHRFAPLRLDLLAQPRARLRVARRACSRAWSGGRRGPSWCACARPTTIARSPRSWRDPEVEGPRSRRRGRAPAVGGLPGPGLPERAERAATPACWPASSTTSRARGAGCPRTGSPPTCATSTGSDGDVDALLARIAAIRTWTYVSHRAAWLSDAGALAGAHAGRWRTGSPTRCTSG